MSTRGVDEYGLESCMPDKKTRPNEIRCFVALTCLNSPSCDKGGNAIQPLDLLQHLFFCMASSSVHPVILDDKKFPPLPHEPRVCPPASDQVANENRTYNGVHLLADLNCPRRHDCVNAEGPMYTRRGQGGIKKGGVEASV